MEKRLLLIVENLSVPFDRRVWREAVSLRKAGYRVTVISQKGVTADRESKTVIDGIRILRYPSFTAGKSLVSYPVEYLIALWMIFILAMGEFMRHGFDAVHICNPPDLLFLPVLPFKLLGVKIVFDHHDLSPEILLSRTRSGKKGPLYRMLVFLERCTFAAADLVIATNGSFKKIALDRGKVPEDRIFVVRNGPHADVVRKLLSGRSGAAAPAQAGRHLIVYVGMMGSQDGVDGLLRAAAKLAERKRVEDFSVLLLGDGPVFKEMKAYAIRLGLSNRVSFTGKADYGTVLEAIRAADLCVCPDPDTGMNRLSTLVKVVEYLSLGKPVVAYDLPETRVTAGDAALYAVPGSEDDFVDRVDLLLSDPGLRRLLGERGRKRFEAELSWECSEVQLLAAYDALFSRTCTKEVLV